MPRHCLVLAHAAAGALLASGALAPSAARAEWVVGVDASAIVPLAEPETNVGWMGSARGGYLFDLNAVKLGPEIGASYGVGTPEASARKSIGAGYAGIRTTLELVPFVTPYAYLHAGFGVADEKNLPDPNAREKFTSGAFFDLTLGLGKRVSPLLLLGLEAGYAAIEPGKCFCARWMHAGLSASFTF